MTAVLVLLLVLAVAVLARRLSAVVDERDDLRDQLAAEALAHTEAELWADVVETTRAEALEQVRHVKDAHAMAIADALNARMEADRLERMLVDHGIDPAGCDECFLEAIEAGPGHHLVPKSALFVVRRDAP